MKYIIDMVSDVGLKDCNPISSPIDVNKNLAVAGQVLTDPEPYRRLVGRSLYLGFTRPDVSYCTQQLNQYMNQPCQHHMQAALRVLRCLQGTRTHGLFYPVNSSLAISGSCDSGWAGCKISRRSLTRFSYS